MVEQTEVVAMSQKELGRLEIIQQLSNHQITQVRTAQMLKLTTRHVRRLHKNYLKEGAKALSSKKRCRPSNNQLDKTQVNKALELLRNEYYGFGPTFAQEKLLEQHQLKFSVESLRKLMIKEGLWEAKQRKQFKHHPMRTRRSSFGELVQIDGSPHDWFEERGERCCLLVFIDDATSYILELRFVPEESTQAYFDATENYLKAYGRPISLYSDKHSIFRINAPEAKDSTGESQFGRALRELDIDLICANSPQAKGRVERANKTLQDRLVKEMRLRGISNIVDANAYLPEFIKKHNQRFSVEAACNVDAHRKSIPNDENFQLIFSHHTTRTVSKNLEVSYNNIIYQIQTQSKSYNMRKAKITVNDRKGMVTLTYKGSKLRFNTFDKNNRPSLILDSKQVNRHVSNKIKYKPKADHPWRNNPVKVTGYISA